jgi:hypothetical protein
MELDSFIVDEWETTNHDRQFSCTLQIPSETDARGNTTAD